MKLRKDSKERNLFFAISRLIVAREFLTESGAWDDAVYLLRQLKDRRYDLGVTEYETEVFYETIKRIGKIATMIDEILSWYQLQSGEDKARVVDGVLERIALEAAEKRKA